MPAILSTRLVRDGSVAECSGARTFATMVASRQAHAESTGSEVMTEEQRTQQAEEVELVVQRLELALANRNVY